MSAHKKSLIREALDRFDQKMALGESRFQAKQAARREAEARGEGIWTYSTGKIHSHQTRITYQQQVLSFLNWVRTTEGLKHLAEVEERAEELVSGYLEDARDDGKSPYTLQTMRSALRLFFGNPTLAAEVVLPPRRREGITRSRGAAVRDQFFVPENWPDLLLFARATGLRARELRRLPVSAVVVRNASRVFVEVTNGKGGKVREVPVLPTYATQVRALVDGREKESLLFARVPDTDIHALRREYAQALYLLHAPPGWALPPATGRLRPTDYWEPAVRLVSRALGHERLEVVLSHYLR